MISKVLFLSIMAIFSTTVLSFMVRPVRASTGARALSMASSFYDITEKDSKGNTVSFSQFKGKVVYGVNVASKVLIRSALFLLSRTISDPTSPV
jgi:hypothetical protein